MEINNLSMILLLGPILVSMKLVIIHNMVRNTIARILLFLFGDSALHDFQRSWAFSSFSALQSSSVAFLHLRLI